MRYSHPTLVDHLASAYVLGTLTYGARRRFERLRRNRADVDHAVTQWELRLGQLAQSVPSIRPPARVWRGIETRIRSFPPKAQTDAPSAWLRPVGWGLAGLSAGALLVATLFLSAPAVFFSIDQLALRSGQQLPQSYVGLLTDAQGEGKLLVSSLRQGRVMTMKVIGPIAPPSTGRLVLWAVAPDAPPFALATVPVKGSAVTVLPDTSEKLLSKVRKLIVTQDSGAQASPGSVVLSGNCAKLW